MNWTSMNEESIAASDDFNSDIIIIVVLEVMICLTFLIGTILNTVLVIIFFRRRGFRTLSNRFVLNLAISNLFCLLMLTPLSILDQAASPVMEEASFCFILTLVSTMVSAVILLSTLLIGLDQYLAIVDPLNYHNRINKKKVVVLCGGMWVVSLVTSLMVVMDPFTTITYFTWSRTCQPQPSLHPYSSYRLWVCVAVVVIVYFIPFLIITLTYVRIFTAARGNSVRTRRNSVSSVRRSSVTSVYGRNVLSPSPRNISRSPSIRSTGQHLLNNFSTLRTSMKSKLHHASALLLYKEETRAARVTVLVVLVVAICWGPYLACLILHTGHTPLSPPSWLLPLSFALLNTYTVISPLIYAYRSKRVQRDVKKVFGMKPRLTKQEKMFKNLKSFSCPHLVLASCQSLSGPGLSKANMKACRSFADMKARQFHLTMVSCSDDQWSDSRTEQTTTELTPCIEITPPTWEPRTSFDSGYNEGRRPSVSMFGGRRRSVDLQKLSLQGMDVCL